MGVHPYHGSSPESSDHNDYAVITEGLELEGDHPNPLQSNPHTASSKPQHSQEGEYPPEMTQPQTQTHPQEEQRYEVSPLTPSASPVGAHASNSTMPPAFSYDHPQPAAEEDVKAGHPSTPFLYFEPPPTYTESNNGGFGLGGSNYHQDYVVDPDEKVPQLPPRRAGKTPSSSSPGAKTGFGNRLLSSVTELANKAGGPVNRLTNRLGSEAFWPASLDKECDKAARILTSFCTGFYSAPAAKATSTDHSSPSPARSPSPFHTINSNTKSPPPLPPRTTPPPQQNKVFVQIPRSAIASAQGLAIFTTLRGGFQISGAAGSGLVVARLPDGSWSPPSAFSVTALGAGFVAGLDIQDCVCVLHTREAVEAFTRPRWTLGAKFGVTAGPVGGGVSGAAAFHQSNSKSISSSSSSSSKNRNAGNDTNGSGNGNENARRRHGFEPIWTYAKSRGLYAGLQADGTVIVQRPDANAAFYGERGISAERILRGLVPSHPRPGAMMKDGERAGEGDLVWPEGARRLVGALKMAGGGDSFMAGESVTRDMGSAGQAPPGAWDFPVVGGGDEKEGGQVRDSVVYK